MKGMKMPDNSNSEMRKLTLTIRSSTCRFTRRQRARMSSISASFTRQADVFTYDPGFTSTASCDSTITFIDGDKGELLHRGYPIDQLAEKSHYLEVCYLLLYGELAVGGRAGDFESRVTNHTMLHEQMHFLSAASAATRIRWRSWSACWRDVGLLSRQHRYQRPWQREVASIRLIAKMPTIAAMAYKYSHRPALRLSAQRSAIMRRISCACALPCRPKITR